MQKSLIFFCFFFLVPLYTSADQISFDNFSFKSLIKNYRRFKITYSAKITNSVGTSFSCRTELNISEKNSFYLFSENLVGGGFFELNVKNDMATFKKAAFKNDIIQENIIKNNKHVIFLRDKAITEWINFQKKYLRYMNFEQDSKQDKTEKEYKIRKLNPTNLVNSSNSDKVINVEGSLKMDSSFKIPIEYYFKIIFGTGNEIDFSLLVAAIQ